MNLYLIRHARQNSQLCNVNVPLAKEGKMQAQLLAERLKDYKIDKLYASDFLRAVETAKIIKEQLKLPLQIREGLREIDYGELEGHTNEEIARIYGDFEKERKAMQKDIPFPGGECGQDVFLRAMPVIEEILQSGCHNAAIVTHGGTIRSLLAGIFLKAQTKKLQFGFSLENCGITQLYYDRAGKEFYLQRFNDYAHLEKNKDLLRKSW